MLSCSAAVATDVHPRQPKEHADRRRDHDHGARVGQLTGFRADFEDGDRVTVAPGGEEPPAGRVDVEVPRPTASNGLAFDQRQLSGVLKDKGYRFVGVARKNRNFFPNGRLHDKRRLAQYGANVLSRDGRWFTTKGKKHRLATRVGQLSKSGRVKLVFSRRAKERAWIATATDETRWSASTILSHYSNRWRLEILFKESKQNLGLGDYQVLRYRGVERYRHLVMIAHLLLTHLGANEPGAQADCHENDPLRLPSVPRLEQVLRSKLWDDTIDAMEKGSRNRRPGKKLQEIIQL
jgi:hypothetical protein